MSASYERLVELVGSARAEVEKAEQGNKAATARVRKMMQEVKGLAQEIRKEMLALRGPGKPPDASPAI